MSMVKIYLKCSKCFGTMPVLQSWVQPGGEIGVRVQSCQCEKEAMRCGSCRFGGEIDLCFGGQPEVLCKKFDEWFDVDAELPCWMPKRNQSEAPKPSPDETEISSPDPIDTYASNAHDVTDALPIVDTEKQEDGPVQG